MKTMLYNFAICVSPLVLGLVINLATSNILLQFSPFGPPIIALHSIAIGLMSMALSIYQFVKINEQNCNKKHNW